MKFTLKLICILSMTIGMTGCFHFLDFDKDPTPPPTISIDNVTAAEGGTLEFTVSFSDYISKGSFKYVVKNLTASDNDHAYFSGFTETVKMLPGSNYATITVPTYRDAISEKNETFAVILTEATDAVIEGDTGIGTIIEVAPPKGVTFHLQANIDGVPWTFESTEDRYPFFSLFLLDAAYDGTVGLNFSLKIDAVPPVGTYPLIRKVPATTPKAFEVQCNFSDGYKWNGVTDSGEFTITHYDNDLAIAEGTFSFTAKNETTGATKKFTNGTFAVVLR